MDVGSEEPSTPLGQQQGSEVFSSPAPSSQTLSPQLFLPSPFARQAHSSFAAKDDALSGGVQRICSTACAKLMHTCVPFINIQKAPVNFHCYHCPGEQWQRVARLVHVAVTSRRWQRVLIPQVLRLFLEAIVLVGSGEHGSQS